MRRAVLALFIILLLVIPVSASGRDLVISHHKTPGVTIGHEKSRSLCNISMIMIGEFVDSNNNGIPEQYEIVRNSMKIIKRMIWNVKEGVKNIENNGYMRYVTYIAEIRYGKGKPNYGPPQKTEITVTVYIPENNVTFRGVYLTENDLLFELNISSWKWISYKSKFFVIYIVDSPNAEVIPEKKDRMITVSVSSDLNVTLNYNFTALADNKTIVPNIGILGNQIFIVYDKFEDFLSHFFVIKLELKKETVEFYEVEYTFGVFPVFVIIMALSASLIILIKKKLSVGLELS